MPEVDPDPWQDAAILRDSLLKRDADIADLFQQLTAAKRERDEARRDLVESTFGYRRAIEVLVKERDALREMLDREREQLAQC